MTQLNKPDSNSGDGLEELIRDIDVNEALYCPGGCKKDEKDVQDAVKATQAHTAKVNRIEVIDETGRAYVKGKQYGTPVKVELSLQDDGKTLKVFVERSELDG